MAINNPKPTTHVPLDDKRENGFQWGAEAYRTFLVKEDGSRLAEENGGIPVNIQDQTSKSIDTYFLRQLSAFDIAVETVPSTATTLNYVFTAAVGHGLAAGNEISLLDTVADIQFYATVLNVATNVITLDRPIDHAFPVAVTTIGQIVSSEMAVDGSTTPVIFTVRAGVNEVDFVRFLIKIIDDAAMDDGKFGGITALTRGLVFRIFNGRKQTIFNFKSNGEIKNFCYDGTYVGATLGPAGNESFQARITFGGPAKHGVVLRVSGTDVLQWIVQDDLTDLVSLRVVGEGHEVTD